MIDIELPGGKDSVVGKTVKALTMHLGTILYFSYGHGDKSLEAPYGRSTNEVYFFDSTLPTMGKKVIYQVASGLRFLK